MKSRAKTKKPSLRIAKPKIAITYQMRKRLVEQVVSELKKGDKTFTTIARHIAKKNGIGFSTLAQWFQDYPKVARKTIATRNNRK